MAKDWSNFTDPDRAMTVGWGNSEQGVKVPKAEIPQANRVILSHLVNHGMSLIDIAKDRGIDYDRLNEYYQGADKDVHGNKLLTKDDDGQLASLVKPFADQHKEYIRSEQAAGRNPKGTLYHDLRDAGYDTEKSWNVKL